MAKRTLEEFRALFPVMSERTYLYSGGVTPAAEPVLRAVNDWIANWVSDPIRTYDELEQLMIDLRSRIAQLVGAPPEAVSIADNTSRASNTVVRGLARRRGTAVVADRGTYPSSLYPWMTMTDKTIRYVGWRDAENATAEVIEAIGPDTTAVTVSHVDARTGHRHDLRALAAAVHAVDGVLIVDAAQSAGVLPIEVNGDGVDILTGTARKWLLGLPGVGFLYARPGLLSPPDEIGHMSFDLASHSDPLRLPTLWPDGRQFELGVPSVPGIVAAQAGIGVLLEVGISHIAEHIENLVRDCIQRLLQRGIAVVTPLDAATRAGIVVVKHAEAATVAAYLKESRIDVGFLAPDLLRVDPHGFNNHTDVQVFADALDGFQGFR